MKLTNCFVNKFIAPMLIPYAVVHSISHDSILVIKLILILTQVC